MDIYRERDRVNNVMVLGGNCFSQKWLCEEMALGKEGCMQIFL